MNFSTIFRVKSGTSYVTYNNEKSNHMGVGILAHFTIKKQKQPGQSGSPCDLPLLRAHFNFSPSFFFSSVTSLDK
jgi:hypothetical protein